jgi:murein DD-endopeptidase MepM/ murein hydrolase activator NlpD
MPRRLLISVALLALIPSAGIARTPAGCFPLSDPYEMGARAAGGQIDILASEGAPVLAPLDGVVVRRGSSRSVGSFVTVRGTLEQYMLGHLRPRSVIVQRGERIRAGDFIGQVGHTGAVDRPVLGIELWKRNRPINPAPVLLQWRRQAC